MRFRTSFPKSIVSDFRFLLLSFSIILSSFQLHADEVHDLITNASGCNNFFLYEEAVKYLNEAIKKNPSEKEAYQERAISYFELGEIDLALQDYQRVINKTPPYRVRHMGCFIQPCSNIFASKDSSLDFAKGLLHGTVIGGREETIEFVSSIRGSLSFLWAFVCSPVDVSKELMDALHAMGEFIAYGRVYDLLEAALPELMECRQYWDTWSEYTKGHKLGYIIGKYSIAAFYYVTAHRGVAIYSQLRRANMMAILERCSLAKGKACILQETVKLAPKNNHILKKALNGSVIAHNPNVAPHVLQKRHYWDKFIRLSGNAQEDFKKVTLFLEEIEILKCERKFKFSTEIITSYKYYKEIGNYTVVAVFEIDKKNFPLLKDAWVKVKAPYVR